MEISFYKGKRGEGIKMEEYFVEGNIREMR
jgi:hypothetical protein